MIKQDDFYLKTESNAFFDRWKASRPTSEVEKLRSNKKEILDLLSEYSDMKNLNVLEIGCFIGDLLGYLKNEYNCSVTGVESSSKACDYAKENFNVDIENATIAQSSLFKLTEENFQKFDLIICDDVLSWVSRDLILPTLAVMDWMLKDGGKIFIRDFSPGFAFAYENHHHPGENIFNFKQPNGHRGFFLNTGKYFEQATHLRTDTQYQVISTQRPDSAVWSDSILMKVAKPLHPVIEM